MYDFNRLAALTQLLARGNMKSRDDQDPHFHLASPEQASARPEASFHITQEPGTTEKVTERHHDLKGALRTLDFFATALGQGYRFGDALADEKARAVARAVQVIQSESRLWLKLFELSTDAKNNGLK
jgi:hypothetical protein